LALLFADYWQLKFAASFTLPLQTATLATPSEKVASVVFMTIQASASTYEQIDQARFELRSQL
jgi:hypothetical protein